MEHDLHLPGPVVTLVPLVAAHAEALAAIGDVEAYAWHTSELPLTTDGGRPRSIDGLLANPTVLALAVTSTSDGALRGITSFYEHAPSVPRVEIGHTYYARRFWGGETNPHTKLRCSPTPSAPGRASGWRCAATPTTPARPRRSSGSGEARGRAARAPAPPRRDGRGHGVLLDPAQPSGPTYGAGCWPARNPAT